MRWLGSIFAGGTPSKDRPEFWSGGTVPWLNSGAVNDWVITRPSAHISEEALAASSARWIPEGSLVIALAGQGKTKGMCARLAIPCTCNQSMAAFTPGPRVDARFVQYWLTSNYERMRFMSGGDNRDGLNLQHIGDIDVPLPPLDMQRQIADFLDDQVERIEQVCILRQRQRRALDGLVAASAAEMVDTLPSVAWTRMSRFWRGIEQGGSPVGTGAAVLGSEPGVVKTSCVKQGVFISDENKALADPAEYEARYRLVPGDLLIVRGSGSGDLVADCAVVLEDVVEKQLMLSDLIYRPVDLQLNPRFVCAFLLSPPGKSQIRALVRQGSGPAKVRGEDIGSVKIPVLSNTEQSRFEAAYWDMREQASRIDQSLQRSLDLLQERKRSLITAAVTGEFDVSSASSRAAEVALSGGGG